jgi:hypothetical protein
MTVVASATAFAVDNLVGVATSELTQKRLEVVEDDDDVGKLLPIVGGVLVWKLLEKGGKEKGKKLLG